MKHATPQTAVLGCGHPPNAAAGPSPQNVEADPEMAWVRNQWPLVASVAWTGYVDEGRGAVVVDEEARTKRLHYMAGRVLEDPVVNALIQSYEPRREVVVVIVHGKEGTFHRLESRPYPPDAVVVHPVERLRSNEPLDTRTDGSGSGPGADDDIDPTLVNEPLVPGDVLVGQACPFCGSVFEVGDLTRWASAGPVNRREYGKARRGLPYMSRSPWPLHCDCGNPKGTGTRTQ